MTYPLSVVTTVTAMNRSGLRAGMLPIMPIYTNWQDAYTRLSKTVCIRIGEIQSINVSFFQEQLKRGSSLFNRAAFGNVGIPTPGTPIPNA